MAEISRRNVIRASVGAFGLSMATGLEGEPPSRGSAEQPNVLMILADQVNAGVLGCYGGPIPTPNIDRLADEGVLFTEATCVTPFCSPSRASILTGRYPHSHGIVTNVNRSDYPAISSLPTEDGIKRGDITTEKLLNEAGYATHHYGKFHLTEYYLPYLPDMYGEGREYAHEMESIFHEVKKRPRKTWMNWYGWAMPVAVAPPLQRAVKALGNKWNGRAYAEFVEKMGRLELPVEKTFEAGVANRTVERLRTLESKPFMITCSFNAPHDPNVVPSPYYESFSPDKIELPANFGHLETRFENEWSRRIVADLGEIGVREFLRIYYASVRLVDDQIGRVLESLERTGRAKDTIVVLSTDHGDMAGGHGMVWKSTSAFYDEIARIPLIIRYPRRFKPQKTGLAASHVDIMPTLLDLLGHPIPQEVQGQSLAPYLLGQRDPAKARAYTFTERVRANSEESRRVYPGTPGSFMVRGRGWKYIRYPDGVEFLYNHKNDPGEVRNLANDPSYQGEKNKLVRELDAWLAETDYPSA